jgi:4-amino-4-deoxy-L-arabinose transferase-like glycosyltransferase
LVPRPSVPLTPRYEAAIVVFAVIVFVALAAFKAARVPYPFFDDVDFLDLANGIRAAGGPVALLRDLFAGRFTQCNRHPLYLALLALFARPELGFHRDAQALAVALGTLALVACWWTARRHAGREAAALLAVMLAGSGALAWTASRECSDALLVVFWALSVGAILDGAGRDDSRAQRAWFFGGVWAGLAYLTKGPGLFLPICLGLTLLLRARFAALRQVGAWLFAAGFALVSSPLWWRNLRVYGSPFYNENGRYFWVDRLPDFAEVYAPHAYARLPHGVREYLAQVTPGSVAWRFGMGLVETLFHLGDALALVAPKVGGVLHVVWVVIGLLAALLAGHCVWSREPGFARTFHLVHAGWWLLFLWFFNANGGASRYFLPLVVTTLVPALAARLISNRRLARSVAVAVVFAAATTLAFDRNPTRPPAGFLEVEEWLVHHLSAGDVYAVDARTHLQPRWLMPAAHQIIVSASWKTAPVPTGEMVSYLCEERVRYVVLDSRSETSGVEEGRTPARYLFYDRMPLEPDGSLPLHGFPEGTRPVYVGPESPRRWMVLETECPQSSS